MKKPFAPTPPESGFVLVLALVVLTLLFAAASGLYLNRQMWAFASTKQLDQTAMDVSTRADAQNWILQFRNEWQQTSDGILRLNTTPVSLASRSAFTNTGGGVFPPLDPYPTYPAIGSFVTMPERFDTSLARNPAPYVSGEPFWGTGSLVGALGVVFKREMDGAERANRFVVPDLTTGGGSHLRAWYSLDGALPLTTVFRVLPVSVFTLFVGAGPSGALDTIDLSPTVAPTDPGLESVGDPYTYGTAPTDYTVDQIGVGRIYVEGKIRSMGNIETGFPVVATEGFVTNGKSFTLYFPQLFGGGTTTATLSSDADFRNNRYSTYRGMMVTSSDSPTRLLRRGSTFDTTTTRWVGSTVTNLATSLGLGVQASITANVVTKTFTVWPSGYNALTTHLSWSGTGNELVFRPPSGYFATFATPPQSLAVYFTGTGASSYSLRLALPSPGVPFTVVVPSNPVIIEDGFNAANASTAQAAMLVAPTVYLAESSPGAQGAYQFFGTLITEAHDPMAPVLYKGAATPPQLEVQGSLVVWRRLAAAPTEPTVQARLLPQLNYLTGAWIPPLTPAVVDVRASSEGFRIYDLGAVEPNP